MLSLSLPPLESVDDPVDWPGPEPESVSSCWSDSVASDSGPRWVGSEEPAAAGVLSESVLVGSGGGGVADVVFFRWGLGVARSRSIGAGVGADLGGVIIGGGKVVLIAIGDYVPCWLFSLL